MKSRPLLAGALSLLCILVSLPAAQALVHPGISHSLADLNRMKNNINVEPYKTAYAVFASSGYSGYNNTGQGPYASEYVDGPAQFAIRNDARVAHQNAVMWYVTGDTRYRDNAINIMMMWANTLTSFQTDDMLTAGTAVFDFCNAGEIIRATGNGAWSAANITTFQNWLLAYLYPPLLYPGGSIAANSLGPAGFGGLQIKGLLALGVFCDRTDIYNFGVSSIQHNGTASYGLLEYIDPVSAQNYETQRDVGHPSGNLGAFAESFYVIYNQGQDLFSLSSNLLARACEVQAKFDLGWDLAPAVWTTKDGVQRSKVSSDNRTPYDNLQSDLVYNIYHNIKGLDMPYTKMSSDLKYPSAGFSFYYLVDSSGKVPTPPLVGEPAATGVRIYEDELAGSYLTNFAPGNYTTTALRAGGMKANNASTLRVPVGWTVIAYDGDNFTGNSLTFTGTLQNRGYANLVTLNFNDRLASMKVTGGGTWPVFDGTYRLINRNSGKAAKVSGSSTANGTPVVQNTYTGNVGALWRVENIGFGNNQYRLTNLNSGKVMEVLGGSPNNGGVIDQWTETYATSPNLATGGTATGNPGSAGEQPAQAFDGNASTKWCKNTAGGTGYLQYQLAAPMVISQYRLVSANDVPGRDPAAWQFQASNDGSTWTTLDTQSGQVFANRFQTNTYEVVNAATAYTYYRVNITANSGGPTQGLQLSEFGLFSSRVTLATNGTATASSGGGGESPAQAFDGNTSSKWCTTVNGSTGFLRYQFPSGVTRIITQYKLTSANDVPERDPAAWQFQGSNDNGATWTTLDTQSSQTFANRFQTNTYTITNTTAYASYRLNITANWGGASHGIQLAELGLYSSFNGGGHQRWTFAPIPGSTYGTYLSVTNANSGKVLDVNGGSTAEGASIIQWTYGGGNNQQWSLMVP